MHNIILLAAALQRWDHYSAHALAARDVAASLARHGTHLHVLTAYDYEMGGTPTMGLSAEMAVQLREQSIGQTDRMVADKMEEYVAPLVREGLAVSKLLRVGNPRHVIVEAAVELRVDLIVMGSHSKRGLFDIALGDTARHVGAHAPCTVVMVTPKK